ELRQRQAFLHLNAIDGHDPPPQNRTFVHFTPREWLNQGILSKRHNQEYFFNFFVFCVCSCFIGDKKHLFA
ncbi:hypothetical protein, partial [Iodobacter sp.]|uniref:hypothetical protein n=1 Tax=Iodobacter sp. TaxID=1915058 RepID=UPI0025D0837C